MKLVEVREAVLRGFAEHGHFPPLARPWQKGEGCFEGWQLVALPKGARLLNQRAHPIAPWVLAGSTKQDFETAEEAVDRYVGLEIGPTYDGVPVR
jgi:hypothetical protein